MNSHIAGPFSNWWNPSYACSLCFTLFKCSDWNAAVLGERTLGEVMVRSLLVAATAFGLALGGAAGAQGTRGDVGAVEDPFRSAKEGGVRRWVGATGFPLELHVGPAISAAISELLPAEAVLSNLGCSEVEGTIWCEVKPLLGGPIGFVRADALRPASGPDGTIPMGGDDSKRRAKKGDFDETGTFRCAQERGQALGTCSVAIARSGGGDATVVVSFSNGFKRSLFFTHGQFMRASATMSGVGTNTEWRLDGQTYVIRVDDQRYQLPAAIVLGVEQDAN